MTEKSKLEIDFASSSFDYNRECCVIDVGSGTVLVSFEAIEDCSQHSAHMFDIKLAFKEAIPKLEAAITSLQSQIHAGSEVLITTHFLNGRTWID